MNDAPLPSRILEIAPDQLTPEQRAGLDALLQGRGRILTPYKVWLHSPELLRAMEQLGTFLNKKCSLSEREVELGICLIAHHWASAYVFRIHAARCVELGYPPAVIEAICDNRAPELPNPREQAVYDVAALAQQPGAGADGTFDRALDVLGRNGLAEVMCLLGYYSAVAIAMKLHRVPVPAGV
jgi:4-carboxymuconolactone decarboxylase